MAIRPETKLVVPAHVLVREIEGEAVFLDTQSKNYLGLDETGTRMWALLTSSESIQSAYEALLREFEVEPEQLKRDLEGLIATLLENKLVEIVSE